MSQLPPPSPYAYAPPNATAGIAVAALVCGLVGLVVPGLGLVGIILGVITLTKPGGSNKAFGVTGIVGGATGLLVTAGCLLSILLPSLNRAREAANQLKCASNMRLIGNALLLYTNDERDGAYPPDLATLARARGDVLDATHFIDPSSNDIAATGPGWEAKLIPGSGNCSFVYHLPPGPSLSATSSNAVVLTEPLSNHRGDGANALFEDGHVEFLQAAQYRRVVSGAK